MSQPIRSQGGHLVFPIGPKNTNFVEDVEIFLPVKFPWFLFSSFGGEVENFSANHRPGRPSCFSDWSKKQKLGRGRWDLSSCQVSLNSVQCKMSQPIRGQGSYLVFTIDPKNTNLVEDVEILLPVKFQWIRFSGFRGEVKNVSANHRLGRPSCFSERPKKQELGRGHWDLASCQVSLNSVQCKMSQPIRGQGSYLVFTIDPKNTNLVEDVEILLPVKFQWIRFSGFREEVKNVSANQRLGRPSCFSERPKKQELGRGHWDLASCQVSVISVQRFQRRSQKCLSQSEARAAILFFRAAQKTRTW